ncbi:hypothetical protein EIP91_007050 [Steccherinum ochraceum]|uniref:Uncharacterized protein n=1 Tax=Steccherinum ochraceum TaxID=92696 RepID=A0A4R0R4S5_9APHY|nr:hypothetical protein EIP91_007050 [Steccherinum ochraceum]
MPRTFRLSRCPPTPESVNPYPSQVAMLSLCSRFLSAFLIGTLPEMISSLPPPAPSVSDLLVICGDLHTIPTERDSRYTADPDKIACRVDFTSFAEDGLLPARTFSAAMDGLKSMECGLLARPEYTKGRTSVMLLGTTTLQVQCDAKSTTSANTHIRPTIFLSHAWPQSIKHHSKLRSLLHRKPLLKRDINTRLAVDVSTPQPIYSNALSA